MDKLENLVNRLEKVTLKLEGKAISGTSASVSIAQDVENFKTKVLGLIPDWEAKVKVLNDPKMNEITEKSIKILYNMFDLVTFRNKCKKPEDNYVRMSVIPSLNGGIKEVKDIGNAIQNISSQDSIIFHFRTKLILQQKDFKLLRFPLL